DFSHAGYRGGGVPLPEVPAVVTVEPVDGDDGARIQAAIDHVSELPLSDEGFRGAVQLLPGRYEVAGSLAISADGVVLRGAGSGEDGTVLVAAGNDRRTLIEVAGSGQPTLRGEPVPVSADHVAVGSMRLPVAST